MLSHLLATQKVESTVVEIRRRREIQETVRAGILEHGTVNMLVGSGVSDPREGRRRDGIVLRFKGESHRIDFKQLAGESVWLYPQTDVFRDLAARREADGGDVRYGVSETTVDASRGSQWSGSPTRTAGTRSRPTSWSEPTAPAATAASRSRRPTHVVLHEYPFAWFGILAEAPRSLDVLIYANSEHGFALVSQRTETVRRMYFQCDPKEDVADWDDERIWTEFRKRVPEPGHPRHPRAVRRPRSLLLHRVHHAARLIQRPGAWNACGKPSTSPTG
jgi:p-hydroxybenzoate 3-monooxygenase